MKKNKTYIIIIAVIIFFIMVTTLSTPPIEEQLIGKWRSEEGYATIEFFENGKGGIRLDYSDYYHPEISWKVEDNTILIDILSDDIFDYYMPISSNKLTYLEFTVYSRDDWLPDTYIENILFEKIQD